MYESQKAGQGIERFPATSTRLPPNQGLKPQQQMRETRAHTWELQLLRQLSQWQPLLPPHCRLHHGLQVGGQLQGWKDPWLGLSQIQAERRLKPSNSHVHCDARGRVMPAVTTGIVPTWSKMCSNVLVQVLHWPRVSCSESFDCGCKLELAALHQETTPNARAVPQMPFLCLPALYWLCLIVWMYNNCVEGCMIKIQGAQ